MHTADYEAVKCMQQSHDNLSALFVNGPAVILAYLLEHHKHVAVGASWRGGGRVLHHGVHNIALVQVACMQQKQQDTGQSKVSSSVLCSMYGMYGMRCTFCR
jgi:hypothetical protein